MLSAGHLEANVAFAFRLIPQPFEKNDRRAVTLRHRSQVDRTVTVIDRVEDSARIKDLVMTQNPGM